MHNLSKIKIFRIVLWITYPVSLVLVYPITLFRKKKESKLLFIFDRYAIGGAQRVHLDILESVINTPKIIYFTRYSPNDKLKQAFWSFPNTECKDIHFWCDYLVFRAFAVHYFAFLINRNDITKVLSSNSTFFYDLLPFLKRKIYKIELLHNFSVGKNGMEFFGLANYKFLDKRTVIDSATQNNIFKQYDKYLVPSKFKERINLIEFGVDIPAFTKKSDVPPLRILYAGRGGEQKRIWILNRIIEFFITSKEPVEFILAGSMTNELSQKVKDNCLVYNEVGEKAIMNSLFSQAHAIILTSAFEGFPVVIKEAMAYGCIPIATALEGIMTHLKHLQNSLLTDSPDNQDLVTVNSIKNIRLLLTNHETLRKLSEEAYDYAAKHFRKEEFFLQYRSILENAT